MCILELYSIIYIYLKHVYKSQSKCVGGSSATLRSRISYIGKNYELSKLIKKNNNRIIIHVLNYSQQFISETMGD